MDDLIGHARQPGPRRDVIARVKATASPSSPRRRFLDAAGKGVSNEVVAAIKTAKVKPAAKSRSHPTSVQPRRRKVIRTRRSRKRKSSAKATTACRSLRTAVSNRMAPLPPGAADDHVEVQISTQNVSGMAGQMAQPLGVPASNIHMHQQNVGGGFGSKFSPDRWSMVAAQLSKMAGGAPVKMMLERRAELEVAGCRPSGFAELRLALRKTAPSPVGNPVRGQRVVPAAEAAADSVRLRHS